MGRVSYGSKQQPDFHPWGRLKVFSAGRCAEAIIEMVMKEFSLCFLPGGGVISGLLPDAKLFGAGC